VTPTPKSCRPHPIWSPLPTENLEKAICGAAATQKRNLCPEPFWRARFAADNMCVETLNLDPVILAMEFTQHAGDENYLQALIDGVPRGGLGRDWTPEETSFPMMKQIEASMRDAKTRNDAARPILEMGRS
jgi:hypothetical protein